MSPLLQMFVVTAVVLFAAASVLRRIAPGRVWQWQARLSFALERAPAPSWRARLGRRLRPPIGGAPGCAVGCASCNGCR